MHREELINLSKARVSHAEVCLREAESDYDDFYIVSRDEAISQLDKAKIIVEQIKLYLNKQY